MGSLSFCASGEDVVGAWLLDVVVEASLTWRTGNRPLPPTVTCFAFPTRELAVLRTDGFGESPLVWPGINTCRVLLFPVSGVVCVLPERPDSDDELDLRETIRGAAFATAVAGMGWVVASSHTTSEAIESRISEGVIDAMVYRVSLLLLYLISLLPEVTEEVADQVLSLRSPGRKNSASPSLLSGLFGG